MTGFPILVDEFLPLAPAGFDNPAERSLDLVIQA